MSSDAKVPSRRRARWLLAWLALTALAFVVHSLAWAPPDHLDAGLSRLSELPPIKPASNALDVFLGPFWVALQALTRDWGVYHAPRGVIACAAGSALALILVRFVLHVRRRLAARPPRHDASRVDLARRRFVIESPLSGAALIVSGVSGYGGIIEPAQLRLRRYRVSIADLPKPLDGLRAVFIADTHLGPRMPAAFIEQAVSQAVDLKPDLVLLGGDYVHAGSRYIDPAANLFKPILDAGIPTVGVLGNHDWYNARGLISLRLQALGVHMVDNSRVFLEARSRRLVRQSPEEALCIAGVGDLLCHRVDLDAALAGVPPSMPRVVLSHNPDAAELSRVQGGASRNRRVDLMLSGHTHGGQISVPLIGPLYVPGDHGSKYAGGRAQGPSFPVIVSRGVGMSICPVRIGVPPELVEVTLERA